MGEKEGGVATSFELKKSDESTDVEALIEKHDLEALDELILRLARRSRELDLLSQASSQHADGAWFSRASYVSMLAADTLERVRLDLNRPNV